MIALLCESKLAQSNWKQLFLTFVIEIFRAWLNEMIAKITAPDLARDVTSAELQLAAHKEYNAEIDARKEAFERFIRTGNGLIADG